MDIKTTPGRYSTLICGDKSPFYNKPDYFEKVLRESAGLVASYPADCREWRTVLVPGLVTKEDITEMAKLLPQDASWQFAQFMNNNCLDPAYNEIYPYTDQEAAELVDYAKTFINGSTLR
jgi:pyruvate formate lyase activating enzyme